MRVRFLVPEALAHLQHLVKTHPISGSFLLLVVFLVVLGVLRRIFGRIGLDMVIFAAIVWGIVLVFGSAAYTFFK